MNKATFVITAFTTILASVATATPRIAEVDMLKTHRITLEGEQIVTIEVEYEASVDNCNTYYFDVQVWDVRDANTNMVFLAPELQSTRKACDRLEFSQKRFSKSVTIERRGISTLYVVTLKDGVTVKLGEDQQ